LGRDVQSGCGFVGDQYFGIAQQRHRYHHALSHPTAQFMGVAFDLAFGIRQAHAPEQRYGVCGRLLARLPQVQDPHLRELIRDGQIGIQAGHRILKDHRDAIAADFPHLLFVQRRKVLTVKQDAAGMNPTVRLRK
jgi:hypothetical protein